jgi:hypothetical protein
VNMRKRSVVLAWLLCLLSIAGATAILIGWLLALTGPPTLKEATEAIGWNWAQPILFSTLAALIITRQPGNRVGWLMMLPAVVPVIPTGSLLDTPPAALTPGIWLLIWLDSWSWVPIIFSVFLIPLHFPTGRPPSPKWNWVNRLAIGMWLLFIILIAFVDTIEPLSGAWQIPNPVGFIPIEVVEGPFLIVWGVGLITLLSASVISLIVRARRAQSVERQQIKWLLYAGAIFIIVYTVAYFASDSEEFGSFPGWLDLLFPLSIMTIPAAIAVAIFRYRLYDIDIIIRRTLVYTVLTTLLALVYFGSVVILQDIVGSLTGEKSPVVIVISTLLIAALFTPLRRRVQSGIDRRFFRRKYDAVQTLAAFARTARDEVELEALSAELLRVVQETVQPVRASLWLSPGKE